MRIVAVSMVRNEADVIEAFVRHAAALVDHHIIFDHHSTDGTALLLTRLADEGLPLTLLTDDRVELDQSRRTEAMFRRAARDHQADWVLPLDGDEFPQADSPRAFRNVLAKHTTPLQYLLTDYAPHPSDSADANPVLRHRHRTAEPPFIFKAIVPGRLAADPAITTEAGNHRLYRNGAEIIPAAQDPSLWLAHYSVRSPAQSVVKLVQHEVQRLVGGHPPGSATHYGQHFQRLALSPRAFLADPGSFLRGVDERPAAYWGTPLRYQLPLTEWERVATCLVPFVEQLATNFGVLRRGLTQQHPPRRSRLQRLWTRLTRQRNAIAITDHFREGLTLPDSRTVHALGCELTVRTATPFSETIQIELAARNTGLGIWRCQTPDVVGTVNLGVQHWNDAQCINKDYRRHALPADVDPGRTVVLSLTVPRLAAGEHWQFDMVSEGVGWFGAVNCQINSIASLRVAA